MEVEDARVGLMVMITKPIETELDGVKRRKGMIGIIDSPVFDGGGLWWWVMHENGVQSRYRYCEFSLIETKKLNSV